MTLNTMGSYVLSAVFPELNFTTLLATTLVVPAPPSAENCLFVAPSSAVYANRLVTFQISLHDDFGNPVMATAGTAASVGVDVAPPCNCTLNISTANSQILVTTRCST